MTGRNLRAPLVMPDEAVARLSRGSAGLNVEGLTVMPDADKTGVATDRVIACSTTLTAVRTYTLPAANSVNAGTMLRFIDLGGLNGSNLLTVTVHSGDTMLHTIGFGVMPIGAAWAFVSDGTSQWTIVSYWGTVAVAQGGTGSTVGTTGFDNLAPTTTRGDLIYRGASGNLRLAKGTSGNFLKQGANDPAWAQPATTDLSDWPLTTRGDIPYAGASNVPTRLAIGTAGKFLKAGASDPAWASIVASDVGNSYSDLGGDHSAPTLTNPTSLTSFGTTISLPANNAVLDDVYELIVNGTYTNTTTSTQVELKLLLGSVVIMDWTCTSLTSNASPRRWGLRVVMHVKTAGASGALFCDIDGYITPGQALSTSPVEMSVGGGAGGILVRNMVNPTGIDFTSTLSFDLQAKFVTSSASQTIQQKQLRINKFAA